ERRVPLAEHAPLQRRRERRAVDGHPIEPGAHVDVVDVVDRAAADRVVRVVLQQGPPQRAELVALVAAGDRVERLAALEEEALAPRVLLLDPDALRVHAAEDRSVAATDELPGERCPGRWQ